MTNELASIAQEKEKPTENYKIEGDDFQNVRITLSPGESMVVDTSALVSRDPYVKMEAKAVGGITNSIKRMFGGEDLFMPVLTNESTGRQEVILGNNFPGQIIPIDIGSYGEDGFYFQPGAFIGSTGKVDVDFKFPGIGASIFGGEGILLQKVHGEGDIFVQAQGNLMMKDLKENESIIVSTGHLVGFEPTVDMSIQTVGGLKTILFGGQGIFDTILRGPGKVLIQSSVGMDRLMVAPTSSSRSTSTGELMGGLLRGFARSN